MFVGYQVEGTLGRRILDGESRVKVFGKEVNVQCNKVAIGGYSAHADQPHLLEWIKPIRNQVKKIFIVQGEEVQANGLKYAIRDTFGIDAIVPDYGDSFEL